MTNNKKISPRDKRHDKIRRKVRGSEERPRLNVYRSTKHICAQIINDDTGKTLVAVSSLSPKLKEKMKSGGNVEAAMIVGEAVAISALEKGIKKVVFDRGGYAFHGRIKKLAESARGKGLDF